VVFRITCRITCRITASSRDDEAIFGMTMDTDD